MSTEVTKPANSSAIFASIKTWSQRALYLWVILQIVPFAVWLLNFVTHLGPDDFGIYYTEFWLLCLILLTFGIWLLSNWQSTKGEYLPEVIREINQSVWRRVVFEAALTLAGIVFLSMFYQYREFVWIVMGIHLIGGWWWLEIRSPFSDNGGWGTSA